MMKNMSKSPAMKRPMPNIGKIRQGGFGITKSKVTRGPMKDVSMTPDTFERSQTRVKKTAVRRRKSYDGDATTQVFGNDTQLSQGDADSALDHTPNTLSQISAIDPSEDDTLTSTFHKKKQKRASTSDATLEMAVQYARGEPDGAERSFTRKHFSKITLDDSDDEGGNDVSMEGVEEADVENNDEVESTSPRKKKKGSANDTKNVKKTAKVSLKIPFKQAAKKLKSLKSAGETQKAKKKINKNFEALPDETTVPKTTNQTWKEKKQQRKMLKNNFDLITSAKKSWEELRRADLPVAKRKKICDDLMAMVVGKVKELSVVHDSARVIQCIVQYGSEQQREIIFEEVKSDLCELCKLKYAKYVIRKLIHYGTKELRVQIFKCFQGQVRKLIRHKEASDIIEYAFNDFATAPQRLAIMEEFYGPTFSLFKDRTHQSLEQIMTDQPEKRDMVIRSMREALMPLIDKEILAYSLVHKVFYDFFAFADDKSKKEMVEGLRDHIPNLLHTRDGTRVAMNCVWSGSVKDRKIIVKSLKTHVAKICKEEHGHFLLLSIFDSVDDTVLVQKVILDEMLKSLDEVVQDQHGRKVLLYLLCPRDSHHFHPHVVKILQEGDNNATSKKDIAVRAKELRAHVSPHLIKYLENNVSPMMTNSHQALLVKEIITHATGDVVPALRAIVKVISQPYSAEDGAINMIEHPACHIALKKIIANDKTRLAAGENVLFSSILLEGLPKSTIKFWSASNRGCFMILSLLDVSSPIITESLKSLLQPLSKSLSKMNFKGAEVLLEKLNGVPKDREYRV